MKNQKIRSAGLFLLVTIMVTGVNAQSLFRDGQRHGQERFRQEFGPRDQRMAQHFSLDLSADQKEEMQALRSEHYKTMKPLRNKVVELKAKERTILSEENVEMKVVNQVIDDQTDLINKIRKLQVKHQVQVKSILTDEQVLKLEQGRKYAKHRRIHHKKWVN